MENIKNLLDAVLNSDPTAFRTAFDLEMAERINNRIEAVKNSVCEDLAGETFEDAEEMDELDEEVALEEEDEELDDQEELEEEEDEEDPVEEDQLHETHYGRKNVSPEKKIGELKRKMNRQNSKIPHGTKFNKKNLRVARNRHQLAKAQRKTRDNHGDTDYNNPKY